MSFEYSHTGESAFSHDEAMVDDGRTPLALAAGLAAALAGGAIWAGLVFVANMEIGYVAWGIGLLVGVAMSRMTAQRSRELALAAAAFAMLGLIAGKAIIFAGSAGSIAKEFENHPQALSGAVAWQMFDARELDDATLAGLDAAQAAGDTLSDALWAAMNDQAAAKLAAMTPAEKHAAALAASRVVMSSLGLVGGIRNQLSLFDLLWVFLAVGTAFRMLAPPKEQPAEEPAVAA